MRKSDRLFQLTNLLRAHQPVTAKVLAEKLRVSERSIYRYVDDLCVSGIPVYGEPGVGYRLLKGFELPPLQLTQSELEALVLGVNMVSGWTGPALSAASHALLSKIEAALPVQNLVRSSSQRTALVPGEHMGAMDGVHWEKIHESIKSEQWIELCYVSLQGDETSRVIYPLGLFYWGGKWTLGSWCSLRAQFRDFRLDRVMRINGVIAQKFLPPNVNINSYIEHQKNQSF